MYCACTSKRMVMSTYVCMCIYLYILISIYQSLFLGFVHDCLLAYYNLKANTFAGVFG